MRIGIDGIPLISPKTGIGHYTLELARALAKINPEDEFDLISPFPFGSSSSENELPANLRKVETRRRKFWWVVGLPLYVRRSATSVFHGTNYEIPLWSRCPTVLSIHDLSLLLYPEVHLNKVVRRARYRLPLMARMATRIITATEFMKREVSEHLKVDPAKIAVTPYAPRSIFRPLSRSETDETRTRLGIEETFILFVGTLEPRKNLITLVQAFAELMKSTDLRPQLVIAGQKGWLIGETLNYIERESLSQRVKLTGYISDEDLRALYSCCAVCVYPSLYEGFGLPPLEAMACGAPVIASDVPSLAETVGQATRVVPAKDVQKLAQAIVEMIREAGQRSHYSRAGVERAARFSWDRTAKLTHDIYREVATKKHKP